jgi:hypothetical protein
MDVIDGPRNFGTLDVRNFGFFPFHPNPCLLLPPLSGGLGRHCSRLTAGIFIWYDSTCYPPSPIMPGPFRRRGAPQEPIDDSDVLPYAQNAGKVGLIHFRPMT